MRLLPAFVVLLIVTPLVELWVLIEVGRRLGTAGAVAIVILTGLIGATAARTQGADVWRRIQMDLSQGIMPATELVDGVLIVIAGIVLVTPGLLTDTMGFLLLVPPVRAAIRRRLQYWFFLP